MSLRNAMEDINSLSVEDKVGVALETFTELFGIIEKKHQDFFHVTYGDENGYIQFLIDLLRVGVAADGKLTQNEIGLMRMIIEQVFQTKFSEEDAVQMFYKTDSDRYKLIRGVAQYIKDVDVTNRMVGFLAAVASIDGRLADEEVDFVDSFFK